MEPARTNLITQHPPIPVYAEEQSASRFSVKNLVAGVAAVALAVAGVAAMIFGQIQVGIVLLGLALAPLGFAIADFTDRHRAINTLQKVRKNETKLRSFEADLEAFLQDMKTSLENKQRGQDAQLMLSLDSQSLLYAVQEDLKKGRDPSASLANLETQLKPLFTDHKEDKALSDSFATLKLVICGFVTYYRSATTHSKTEHTNFALGRYSETSLTSLNTALKNVHTFYKTVIVSRANFLNPSAGYSA